MLWQALFVWVCLTRSALGRLNILALLRLYRWVRPGWVTLVAVVYNVRKSFLK